MVAKQKTSSESPTMPKTVKTAKGVLKQKSPSPKREQKDAAKAITKQKSPSPKRERKDAVVDPRSVGLDPSMIKEYEVAMQKLVNLGKLPGCASMVWRHGKLVQCGGWGVADIQKSKPFDVNTLCRIICATKCLVSICVMTLVEEGKIGLDDPVHKYIAAFKNARVMSEKDNTKTVKLEQPILLWHCLTHMSGIDYGPDPTEQAETPVTQRLVGLQQTALRGDIRTLEDFVDRLATVPLSCQPGRKYIYSYSYDVLARIVEIVCGKSFDKCLSERVLQPLGMADTMWAVPESKSDRLSPLYGGAEQYEVLYSKASKHSLLHGPGRTPYSKMVHNGKGAVEIERGGKASMFIEGRQCPIIAGGGYMAYDAGGLVSTAADIGKMVKMLFNYGLADNGKRLLQESTVKNMEVNRRTQWDDEDHGGQSLIGLIGSFVTGTGDVGMGGAANTYWNIDREAGTATVWFCQHLDFWQPHEDPDAYADTGLDPKHADLWGMLRSARLPESTAFTNKAKAGSKTQPRKSKFGVAGGA